MSDRFPEDFYVCANPDQRISVAETERSLLHDPIVSSSSIQIHLGQIGDSAKHRPPIYEFLCEMRSGLLATFRARDVGSIPQMFSPVDVKSHPLRHRLAFVVSHSVQFDLCPMTVIREHPTLGIGTFTGTAFAEPFLLVGMLKSGKLGTVSRRVVKREQSFPEALIFGAIIGDGRRMESSYIVDSRDRVILQYCHEAFVFDDEARDRRIEAVFRGTSRKVSPLFWRSVGVLTDRDSMPTRRIRHHLNELGLEVADAFFDNARRIFMDRRLGDVEILAS